MGHDELQEDLASHLRGNTSRMVWTNTQLGPVGSPRPDVFTIDKSYARFACDAYEIKVSVSDLRRDTTSGKWQSYRKFSHRVWFAFERGLAPLDEIPRECGVILRSDAGWRAARKPVAQALDTMPRDAWLKLLIESHPVDVFGHQNKPRSANDWHMEKVARARLGDRFAELWRARSTAGAIYELRTRELAEASAKIEGEIEQQRQHARRRAEDLERQLSEAEQHMAQALGLSRHVKLDELVRRINEFRWSIQRGAGLDNAIASLEKLRELVRCQADDDATKEAA